MILALSVLALVAALAVAGTVAVWEGAEVLALVLLVVALLLLLYALTLSIRV